MISEFSNVEYIRGYDIDGNEKLWIITSGNVNTLALIDINGNGKNEVRQLMRIHITLMNKFVFFCCIIRLFVAVTMVQLKYTKMIRFYWSFSRIRMLFKLVKLVR